MEIIIGAVIIIVLALCLGVGWAAISIAILMISFVGTLFMLAFFAYSLTMLARSKKCSAQFVRIDKKEKHKFEAAFYEVNGEEYPNAFPCEPILRDKFYKKNTKTHVRFVEKKSYVLDKNAQVTIAIGTLFCLIWIMLALQFVVGQGII